MPRTTATAVSSQLVSNARMVGLIAALPDVFGAIDVVGPQDEGVVVAVVPRPDPDRCQSQPGIERTGRLVGDTDLEGEMAGPGGDGRFDQRDHQPATDPATPHALIDEEIGDMCFVTHQHHPAEADDLPLPLGHQIHPVLGIELFGEDLGRPGPGLMRVLQRHDALEVAGGHRADIHHRGPHGPS